MDTLRQPLTRQRIVELALVIIDAEGLGALNVRRLAHEAGVQPMTLYHHFPNKDAILNGVAEMIAAAALVEVGPVESWRDRVRALFASLHHLVQAHPRALPLISTGVLRTPSGRRWVNELMATLLEAGFSADSAATMYHTLGGYTLGLGYATLLGLEVSPESIVGELAGHWQDYPAMLQVGMRLAAWDTGDEFETGLDVLLAHFATKLDES